MLQNNAELLQSMLQAFDAFKEADHPRGQPKNSGQFAKTSSKQVAAKLVKKQAVEPAAKKSGGPVHREVREDLSSRGLKKVKTTTPESELETMREEWEHPSKANARVTHEPEWKEGPRVMKSWAHPAQSSVMFGHKTKNTGPEWNANKKMPEYLHTGQVTPTMEKAVGKLFKRKTP